MATSNTRKSSAAKPAAKSNARKSSAAKPAVKATATAAPAAAAKVRPSKAAATQPSKGALQVTAGRKHTHVRDSSGAKVAWIPTEGGAALLAGGGKPGRVRVNFDGGAWVATGQVEAVLKALKTA